MVFDLTPPSYLYRAPPGREGGLGTHHLTLDEVGFQWDWINGEMGCGEDVSRATEKRYKRQLQKYLERTGGGQDAEEYLKQVEDIKAKLATGEYTTWPPRSS